MDNDWLEKKNIPWCFRSNSAELAKGNKAFIINLDDSDNDGTHWVAARRVGKTLFYADPFGTVLGGYPPEELQALGLKMINNEISWQRPDTQWCGYYAYRFTKALNKLKENSSQKDLESALWQSIK